MESWKRSHTGIDVHALVLPQVDGYLISIKEPKGENRVPVDYKSNDENEAKRQADEVVQSFYKHACDKPQCEEWRKTNEFI